MPSTNQSTNLFSKSLLLGLAGLVSAAQAAPVLVIDEGVDLDHSALAQYLNPNSAESSGRSFADDDRDGFVDNILGWNVISNDAVYMPPKIRSFFVEHTAEVSQIFDLYSRALHGDAQARQRLRDNPELMEAGGTLMELSHGTHVAGIIAKQSRQTARMQSLNVFTGSDAEISNTPEEEGSSASLVTPASTFSPKTFIKRLHARFAARNNDSQTVAAAGSIFDDASQIDQFLGQTRTDAQTEKVIMTNYVRASGAKVANISLGMAMINIENAGEQIWQDDLTRRGLPKSTPRSSAQQANYIRLVRGVFGIYEDQWNTVFSSNPDVLFVIAAGNDGDGEDVENPGDNDVHPVIPANASGRFRNVITIAATDDRGAIMDFSNHSPRLVNIGAPGHAIDSLAPGNHMVAMSGTSMASPYVAGVATRLRTIAPRLAATEIRAILEATARPTASLAGKTSTGGMVDAEAAAAEAARRNGGNGPRNPHGFIQRPIQLDDTSIGEVTRSSDLEKSILRTF